MEQRISENISLFVEGLYTEKIRVLGLSDSDVVVIIYVGLTV